MFSSQRQMLFIMMFLVTTTSFAIINVSAEIERQAYSTALYGETDDEELGDMSILDVLLRKRREGCDNNDNEKVDEVFYERVDEVPKAVNETEISVEQAEIVSYEDILNGGEDIETNTSPMADFLTPPAENANCTNYNAGDHDETKADTAENTEKTFAVDATSGTVLVA